MPIRSRFLHLFVSALLGPMLLGGCGNRSGIVPRTGNGDDPTAGLGIPRRERLVEHLLVVALDGASWTLLAPLMAEGRLPTFSRLAEEGVTAELATLEPTLSPAIWTTIATGVPPAVHGILGFDGVPGRTMTTLPNSAMRRVKAYWNILADAGLTTGTIGWWVTWPAEAVGPGSYMVSDRVAYTRMEAAVHLETTSESDVWPHELEDEVRSLVEAPSAIDPAVVESFLGLDRRQMQRRLFETRYEVGNPLLEFQYAYQSDRSTFEIAERLLVEKPVVVAAVYFTGIDTVSHLYWHFTFPEEFPKYQVPEREVRQFGDVIRRYYALIDGYIDGLLAGAGPETTVLVVSDHGFGGTGYLPWSGGHDGITPGAPVAPPGVLLLAGPRIVHLETRLEAHVLDIAPTLLHLMGLPAAEDMPGRVLVEALAPDLPMPLSRIESWETVGTPRDHRDPAVDPAGDAERRQRLRALGYLD